MSTEVLCLNSKILLSNIAKLCDKVFSCGLWYDISVEYAKLVIS